MATHPKELLASCASSLILACSGMAHAQATGGVPPATRAAHNTAASDRSQASTPAEATATPAGGQADRSSAPASTIAPASKMEEVIVTAQKRSTSLQKLPATVTVVGGAALKTFEIRSLSQLKNIVPGYNFEPSPGGNQVIAVRGVSTSSSAQSLEQSVAAYIDGVYIGGNLREFSTPLYDLQQVEVLKGAQSGIAGQNTSVAALNIVTKQPGNGFGGYIEAGHEFAFNGYNAEGAVNLPVSDKLKVRLSGLYDDAGNYVYDEATHTHTGGSKNYSGRLTADWRANDTVDVKLYVQDDQGDSLSNTLIPIGPEGPIYSFLAPGIDGYGSTAVNFGSRGEHGGNDYYHYNNLRSSLTVSVDLGGPTLTSITAASRINDRLGVDGDVSPLDLSWLAQQSHYYQVHQEVRLVSPSNERLTYIVGAWYRHAQTDKTIDFYLDIPPPGPPLHFVADIPFLQTTDTGSVFGDVHYKITPQLVVGTTLRYTYEVKQGQIADYGTGVPPTFPPYPLTRGELTPSFLDGSATVQYLPSDWAQFYGLYTHGTKTGAFIDLSASLVSLRPERTNTFEIGTKLRAPGAHLTFNLSAFTMEVNNFQDVFAVRQNGTTFFEAVNRNLHTEGLEAQSDWHPLDGLTLGAAATLLDSRNDGGGRSAYAPKLTVAANARYETPLGSGSGWNAAIFGDVYHTSKYLNNVETPEPGFTATAGYTTADLGVTAFKDRGLSIKFIAKNICNTHAYTLVANNPVDPDERQGALLPLRRFVLSLGYTF